MRTEYIEPEDVARLLGDLPPVARLVCDTCLETGLRVGDVVALRRKDLGETITVKEAKTGKKRTVTITPALLRRLRANAGRRWVFPGAWDPDKHRTRQSVWWAVKRSARRLALPSNVAPHSLRKVYAVRAYEATRGDLAAVQRAMRHDRITTTLIYAMAREMYRAKYGEGGESEGGDHGDASPL